MSSQQDLVQILKETGHRITKGRLAVLDVLLKKGRAPISAEIIYKEIKKNKKISCDLASVYRTLAVLFEQGAIQKSDVFGGVQHYELADKGHRHHIVCQKCKRIDPIDFCLVKGQEQVLVKLGYQKIHHRLEFSGLCPSCA